MTTHPRSRASSFLLTVIGTALSGTIAAFIVIMIYFTTFQLAAAGLPPRRRQCTSTRKFSAADHRSRCP